MADQVPRHFLLTLVLSLISLDSHTRTDCILSTNDQSFKFGSYFGLRAAVQKDSFHFWLNTRLKALEKPHQLYLRKQINPMDFTFFYTVASAPS